MNTAWTFLAFIAFRAMAVSAATTYGYTIYYEEDSANCANSVVSVRSWVSGELYDSYGVNASDVPCSFKTLCALNPESEQCKSLVPGAFTSLNATVLSNGTVLLCRNVTNCVVTTKCDPSVSYPGCKFAMSSLEEVLADTKLIENTQLATTAINESSYVLYYTDSQCSNLAGMRGLVSGNNSGVTFTTTTNTSGVSCSDAMACLVSSDGPICQAIPDKGTDEIISNVNADGSVVNVCNNGECVDRSPSDCYPSMSYYGCYTRRLSGKVLFENPSQYVKAAAGPTPAGPTPAGPTPAGPTPAGPTVRTSSALENTHRILGAGLAVLQALVF